MFKAAVVAVWVFWYVNRKSKVIVKSSPIFCYDMLLGFLLGFAALLTMVGRPSAAKCASTIWLFSLGFALVFGNLLVKTNRIYKIFLNKKLSRTVMRDKDLMLHLGGFVALECIVLILWSATVDPTRKNRVPQQQRPGAVLYRPHGRRRRCLYPSRGAQGGVCRCGVLPGLPNSRGDVGL